MLWDIEQPMQMRWQLTRTTITSIQVADVWQWNFYGAWSCIVRCPYLITIFTLLFSEGGLSLPRFLHESIQVMTLWNYEIDALCDFRLLHLLANLVSIPNLGLEFCQDLPRDLSLECCQDLPSNEEVENQNESDRLSQLASWKQY